MGKLAFLFAGQGAQHPRMGYELARREHAASDVLSKLESKMPGLCRLCWEDTAQELAQTANTQPSVFAMSLAAAHALASHGVIPEAVAGFSLGEISALTFAGAFSLLDGFALVRYRGDLMNRESALHPGAMRAVIKLSATQVETLAKEAGAWPVNYNSPQQTVVAGSEEALLRLDTLVRREGGRSLRVAVSGAFHSPYMIGASKGLAAWLTDVPPTPTRMPVISNVTAHSYPSDADAMAALIARQVSNPVLWQASIERLCAKGFDCFVEVGPGNTLTQLVKRIAPSAKAFSCETPAELDHIVAFTRGDNYERLG